jgi:small-conductance mechanosensitive channel
MIIILVLLLSLAVAPAAAQVGDSPDVSAPSATPDVTPIPASDIPTRAGAVRDMVRAAEAAVAPDERLVQIQQAFPGEQERIAALVEQTDELLQTPGRVSQIQESQKASVRSRDRLERWMRDLSTRSSAMESTLRELQDERRLWELTRDQEREDELPEALLEQVTEVIEILRGGEDGARSARDAVLALQAGVAQQQSALDEILVRQQEGVAERSVGIFEADSPPLWRAFDAVGTEEMGVIEQMGALAQRQLQDLRGYIAERGTILLTWVLLWIGMAVTLILMRRKARLWVQQDRSLATTVAMLDRPMTAAAVIILAVANLFDQQAPTAWFDLVNLLLLLTLLLLLFGILAKALRPLPYLLMAIFVLMRLVQLSPVASLTQRLAMLALSLVGIAFCWWFLRSLRKHPDEVPEAWRRWVARGLWCAIGVLTVSLLANITGSVRFGSLTAVGTIDAIFTAIILVVVGAVLRAMVRVALLSKTARRLGIAPEHSDAVRRALFRTISLIATVVWIVFTLKGFMVHDQLIAKLGAMLAAEASIGEFSISLGDVLIFVFIIWLSIKLAALVDFVLEVIVLQHVTLPVGVPQTISRLSRYTVILIGVMVAFSAIGFDVSKAALVAGGLGVGIGFGLQNIVNNFVSGLILLFERPIRVGDTIELGATSGVVEKIGMRATLIRTWTGPELVVPNAQLVSSEVLNWNLKRDRKRAEVPVGVAYDSDPEVVAEILTEVAVAHPDVLKHPEPECLFLGFGDSSLNFQVRAWAGTDNCFRVQSDLRFAIRKALTDAGIEIPFPQRDLHIRTTTDESPKDA